MFKVSNPASTTILFLTALSLTQMASSVSTPHQAEHPTPIPLGSVNTYYENYIYVSEWAGTVCRFSPCRHNQVKTKHFNLHGLWPEYFNGSWPQKCTTTP